MAFFRKDDPAASAPAPRAATPSRSEPMTTASTTASRVAPGSRFEGKLEGGTDVVIDGELVGEVVLGAALTVGSRGRVEARVHARSVHVGGELRGDVVVDERLEVLAGGKLQGDVRAPRVAIAEGGFFRGHIDMGSSPDAKTAPQQRAGSRTEVVEEPSASRSEEAG